MPITNFSSVRRSPTMRPHYAHTEAKFLELGILKFTNINIYLIGNFVYRFCNNLLPPYFNSFLIKIHVVHDHYTRNRDNFAIQYARTDYRKFSLRCRGPEVWNLIPLNLRDLKTFYSFKRNWKKYMIHDYT